MHYLTGSDWLLLVAVALATAVFYLFLFQEQESTIDVHIKDRKGLRELLRKFLKGGKRWLRRLF